MKQCTIVFITFVGILYFRVSGYETRNAIILVVDGSRYTETFGDSTHRHIPRIWNELRPLGTIYTRFYNEGITSTCPGHASIVTGAWQNISNDGYMLPETPTMFEYFNKKFDTSSTGTGYVILGKSKLSILASSIADGYGPSYGALVVCGANYIDDKETWNTLHKVLTTSHPRLAIANLGQVDALGHRCDWEGYLASIYQADSIVGLVWDLLQTDPFYKDCTVLFVVNDHGRHTDDFISHGDDCEGCRHLMCLMIGPDTKAGEIDTTFRQQIDIVPTIGHLLGFPTPLATGKSLLPMAVPEPPLLLEPEDAVTVSVDTVMFTWDASTSGASRFCLEIATDSLMRDIIYFDSLVTESQKRHKISRNRTTCWWRVRGFAPSGWTDWSKRNRFRAEIASYDPVPDYMNRFDTRGPGTGNIITVDYSLPRFSSVSITVSNLQGRILASLFKSDQYVGTHTAFVNVSSLSRGCYIVDFEANAFSKRKIVIRY